MTERILSPAAGSHRPCAVGVPGGLTILLPSAASSALSLRSGSVCATLLTGKMLPADRGRFLRPHGAEHMHARTTCTTTTTGAHGQTQTGGGGSPLFSRSLLCPLPGGRRAAEGIRKQGFGDGGGEEKAQSPRGSARWIPGSRTVSRAARSPGSCPVCSPRREEESHLQPLLKAERGGGSSVCCRFRRARARSLAHVCEEDSDTSQQQNKSTVTGRLMDGYRFHHHNYIMIT